MNWDEYRTAFEVARLEKVSAAADALGVHHATVIRHVDALEARLGVKLFQRHPKGYTPTDAGRELLRVGAAADDQFSQLEMRIKGLGAGLTGEFVLTALPSLSHILAPVLSRFQEAHPELVIRFLTSTRLFALQQGEAHVAIRAGAAPKDPDVVVKPLMQDQVGLFASRAFVAKNGQPETMKALKELRFVAHDSLDSPAVFNQWLRREIPVRSITFRTTNEAAIEAAIRAGAGVGFLPRRKAKEDPDLIEIWPAQAEWAALFWVVTHVDLHRSPKVQMFLNHLKDEVPLWEV